MSELSRRSAALLVLASAGVAGSFVAMRSAALEERERALAVRVRRPRGRVIDGLMSAGTDLGSVYAVIGTGAVLRARGRHRVARDVIAAGSLGWLVAQTLKQVVRRPRPYQVEDVQRLVTEPAGSSWPSGHPAVAAAAATVLAPQLPRRGRALAAVTAGFVALSRVYVGVHYPTDVIAGLGVGSLCGLAARPARLPG